MRRAFHEKRGSDIPVKHGVITWPALNDSPAKLLSIEEILNADAEYS